MTLGPDLILDPLTGDLRLDDGAPIAAADVAQAILIRLRFILGEWFLDTEAGLPYFERIFVKAPQIDQLRVLYRTEILETPGVRELLALEMDFDANARRLDVSFRADTDQGEIDQAVAFPFPGA